MELTGGFKFLCLLLFILHFCKQERDVFTVWALKVELPYCEEWAGSSNLEDNLLCGGADNVICLCQFHTLELSPRILQNKCIIWTQPCRWTKDSSIPLLSAISQVNICIKIGRKDSFTTFETIPNFSNFWTASSTSKLQFKSNSSLIRLSHSLSRSSCKKLATALWSKV